MMRRMVKVFLLLIVFLVYLLTLPSDIGLGDSGTLAAAAVNWGIPHPPGFPSWILISHWFSYMPWGSLAQKLAMVSVLASVATVGLVMEMAGIVPALILAFSYGFWSQAVNVETYALTNLVIVLVMRGIGEIGGGIRGVILGVVMGIGVGLNPIVVGVIPSLIFNFKFLKIFQFIVPALSVAVAIYSYLPLRAFQNPFLNWSDPSSLERFFKHLTGGGLSMVSSTAVNGFTGSFYWLINSFGRFIYVFFAETLGVGMILAIIGGYFMFKCDRKKFWYWVILVCTNVILAGIYVSGNRDSWYVTGMIGGMMLMGGNTPWPPLKLRGGDRIRSGAILVGWLLPFIFLMVWGPRMWDRARSNYVGTYINDLYKDLPEGAILIGGGETFNSLTLYAHEAIKKRSDITPVDFTIYYGQEWYRKNGEDRGDWRNEGVDMAKFTNEGEFGWILEQFVEANKQRPIFISGSLLRRPIYGGSLNPAYVPERFRLEQRGIVYRMVDLKFKGSLITPLEFPLIKGEGERGWYLESNYRKAIEDIQLDYGLALEMRGDFFGAARVAPKYFDQNRLNTKIKELERVK